MHGFQIHTIDTAPAASREALGAIVERYGFLPNVAAVMAESPAALAGFLGIAGAFDSEVATLTPAERQVVLLAVSVENGCNYCAAAHTMLAGMVGVPEDQVRAIRDGEPLADPRREALRRFTARVVARRGRPGPDHVREFLDAGFTRGQLLEVMLGVGLKTITNYVNHIADPALNEQFANCALPARDATRATMA